MPKKKTITDLSTRTVSTGISILDDSHVNKIRKEFSFLADYNIQQGIDDAVVWYKLLSQMPKEPTPKQSNIRLSFIQDKISELTGALDNLSLKEKISIMRVAENRPQKFKANDTIDYLNELSLQIAVAQSKEGNVVGKVGRNKKTQQSVFLNTLYSVYADGTGQGIKCSYSDYETRYISDFVWFCEYVIDIYDLPIGNSAIGEFTQKKNKEKKLKNKSETTTKND